MTKALMDRVAIITGAASGIGRAAALAFAREGIKVLASDVDESGGQETVKLISQDRGAAFFFKADVSQAGQVKAMVEKAVTTYGRLDYAFNNAGVEGESASTADCSESNWDKVLGINLKGVWLCMKHEIPHMLRHGKGAIVNNASIAGLVGFTQIPAYCAAKGGVIQLTRAAALEYAATGLRINAVLPGAIQTPMLTRSFGNDPEAEKQFIGQVPMGRAGTPEEIAAAVLWLCSDAASYVQGHMLVVDGGWVAR